MGLTKQYLRYAPSAVFGVIGSQKANVAYVTLRGGERGRYVAVAACEHVFIWDVRKGEKVLILQGQKHEVSFLCPSPDGVHVAVGYEDGAVRIFSLLNGESSIAFNGHKTAVTVMNYDALGARLVTGSKDTDVIVWDIINECGLYRLRGHKDVITQALFLKDKNLMVTSSKDSFVKWWDLDTQHCFKTMVGHRSEVWGLALLNQEKRLLTGSADSELRAWDIVDLEEDKAEGEPKVKKGKTLLEDNNEEEEEEKEDDSLGERILSCRKAGSILREARDRVVSMTTDSRARVVGCHGNDSVLELFTVLSEEEVQRKMNKKMKKAKKKAAKAQEAAAGGAAEPVVERMLKDEIVRLTNIKASAKIRWADCLSCAGGELKVALLLQNNTIETYSLKTSDKNPSASKTARLTLGGHRTDARTLAFSSDNLAVLSASGDTVKVWNRSTLQVIRTMTCEYALCSLFVPGDRQIILGTKSGKLQIFELASGSLLETLDAHDGALWSLCLAPDQRGIVTGAADKTVKFWEFELIKDQSTAQKAVNLESGGKKVLLIQPSNTSTELEKAVQMRTKTAHSSEVRLSQSKSMVLQEFEPPQKTMQLKNEYLNVAKLSTEGKKQKKSWSLMWTVLTADHLLFYKDKQETGLTPSGKSDTVQLCGTVIEWTNQKSRRKNVFQVTTTTGSEYLVQNDCYLTALKWYNAIRKNANSSTKEEKGQLQRSNSTEHLSRFRSSSSYASTSPSTKQRNPAHRRSINVFSSTKLKHSASDSTDKNGVKNRLKKFMTRRPSMKTLQEKGLIKDQVFGSHLSTLCKREGTTVPQFIQTCLDAIEKRGLETDGIYRVSGNLATIQKLRFVVDHEEELDLDHHQWEDIHVVTGALKLFFRELSEPLFPFSFFQPFVEAIKIKDHQEKLDAVRKLVQQLPRPNYDIMKLLFSHLQRVLLHSKKNLMSTQGIAIVFGPTLMWPNLDAGNVAVNMVYQNHIVEFILIESQNIFVMDKK